MVPAENKAETPFVGQPFCKSNSSSSSLGVKPEDSCVNQLSNNAHELFLIFDDNCEVREVFLGISKAINKVRHEGIIHKLTRNRISGN